MEEGLIGPEGLHIPEPASFEMLVAVHDPDYVRHVLAAEVAPKVQRTIGMPAAEPIAKL